MRRPPARYGDWVYSSSEDDSPPSNVVEAMASNESTNWVTAMNCEIDSMIRNDVWELVDLPKGKQPVKYKWVFKVKYDSDGRLIKHKARLVAQGFTQKPGVDYDETFSPVIRFESVRVLIAMSLQNNFILHQMDVSCAFLNGDLHEDIYMHQPDGFQVSGKEHMYCKLNKSIYGLKQSPRCWNFCIDSKLNDLGFMQSPSDPCLYSNKEKDFFIAVYVDDLILPAKSEIELNRVKVALSKSFVMKDLGELNYFLGAKVIQSAKKESIHVVQPSYTADLLKKFNMIDCKPISTPVDVGSKLCKWSENDDLCDIKTYQSCVGSLLYLAGRTRPDIMYAVYNVSKFSCKPTKTHWTAVKRILRYLKGTMNYGLLYTKVGSSFDCVGYSDSDWAGDLNDRKSTSGFVFIMSGAPVSWSTKKQSCIALSTAEAEYVALSRAVQEALWLQQILTDLNCKNSKPMLLYEDNQSCIAICKNSVFHGKTKHIDIKYNFVKDHIDKKDIEVKYCSTDLMLADIFTKGLLGNKFQSLCNLIGIVDD